MASIIVVVEQTFGNLARACLLVADRGGGGGSEGSDLARVVGVGFPLRQMDHGDVDLATLTLAGGKGMETRRDETRREEGGGGEGN